ncbi:MAG TPA: sigma-70 family RNA polymerase sigma factor [Steroidobacteraceae bacterium]|nr:sigma-70 family RNA polymerase sigma factor [Steroidobacteraceae bacterium]
MADRTEPTTEGAAPSDAASHAGSAALGTPADQARLRDGVVALLQSLLGDPSLAQDLCHETFRIVLERLARRPLEDPARLPAFLAQTARYLAIEHRKRAARRRTMTGQQDAIDAAPDPRDDHDLTLHEEASVRAVRRLLRELRWPRDREILVRVYLHEQDKETVCRQLGIDEEHYKRVLHRARARLAVLLQRRYRRSDLFCSALF